MTRLKSFKKVIFRYPKPPLKIVCLPLPTQRFKRWVGRYFFFLQNNKLVAKLVQLMHQIDLNEHEMGFFLSESIIFAFLFISQ